MYQKLQKKSHFEIRRYGMPPRKFNKTISTISMNKMQFERLRSGQNLLNVESKMADGGIIDK